MTSKISSKGIFTTPPITANSTLKIEYKNAPSSGLDMNGDGSVNVSDIMYIVNYILAH